MSKKVPVYKKKGDVLVEAGEIEVGKVLEDLSEEGIEDVEAAYVLEEEEELPEEEEQKVYSYRAE